MTKNAIKLAVAATAMALPGAALAQQVPAAIVAVVDTNTIFSSCTACVAANTVIEGQATALQSRAQVLGAPLETESQAIQTALQAAGGTPDAALQQRIQSFQTRQQTAQQELGTQRQTIQRNAQYVRSQIMERLGPIVQQQMTARGANLAIDSGSTFAHSETIDITASVLTALNAALPSVNTTAPAPAAAPAAAPTEGR